MSQNKLLILFFALFSSIVLLLGCDQGKLVDSNISMPSRNWNYANKVKVQVDIKDNKQALDIHFKLRHTADYRYSNIFVLLHIKSAGKKRTIRYEYKLAQPDGKWNGSGSGNLFTYTLPMLTNYKFPAQGVYELEVEQNMRDNPLAEISDVGIRVSKQGQ